MTVVVGYDGSDSGDDAVFSLLGLFNHWTAGGLDSFNARLGLKPDQLQTVLTYGIPVVLCYALVERPVRFGLCLGAILLMAVLNEVVWRSVSTDAWVAFKTFGFLPLTVLFALAQTPLIMRHNTDKQNV